MVHSVEMQLIKNQIRCEPGEYLIKNTWINAEFKYCADRHQIPDT